MRLDFWRKSAPEDENAAFYQAFEELSGHPPIDTIREWTDKELHKQLTSGVLHPAERSLAEEEKLDRRAWRGPGGRAVKISRFALAVSLAAFLLSLWAAFKPAAG